MVNQLKKRRGDKPSRSRFVYKAVPDSAIKKRAEQTGGGFDSPFKPKFDTWRPQAGENVIRILPPTWENYEHYGYDLWVHSWVGPDRSTYACPRKMKSKPCPICEAASESRAAGEDEEAKQLSATRKVVVWIINRDEEDDKPKPELYMMSWSQDQEIAERSRSRRSGKVLHIDHPDDGNDVIVKRRGTKLNTRYTIDVDREPSPISDDEDDQEEILDYIRENPIPRTFHYFDEEYLEKVANGTVSARDEDDEDEDDPKKKKRRSSRDEDDEDEDETPKRKRRKPADDDEDEDDDPPPRRKRRDADEDEDEDEEDDPPKKKRRKPADDDDEDEEDDPPKKKRRKPADDDDEEEEDDPPKKKRKKPADDDEDEEDEEEDSDDDEEEDEEEPPKRRARGRRKTTRGRR